MRFFNNTRNLVKVNESEKLAEKKSMSTKKGEPTPKRKEQEANRKRPLVPKDKKLARQNNKKQRIAQREKVRAGIAAGDEKYLTPRDRGPQKRYLREYIDSRRNVGEFFLPIMFPLLFLSYIRHPIINLIFLASITTMFLGMFIDGFIIRKQIRKNLQEKFGTIERGTTFYAISRATQIRRMRLPKPVVSKRKK